MCFFPKKKKAKIRNEEEVAWVHLQESVESLPVLSLRCSLEGGVDHEALQKENL